jgi:hypothetical protein
MNINHFYSRMTGNSTIVSDSDWKAGFDRRHKLRIFPLICVSRPALRPAQPPVKYVPGVLSPRVKRSHSHHLLPRSGKSRNFIPSLPWRLHGGIGTGFYTAAVIEGRSQWPRSLRRRSTAAWLLGSRVRIPLGAWMFVSCVYMLCCPV